MRERAIRFEKYHHSRTYLILCEEKPELGIIAFFSLTFKETTFTADLSRKINKELTGSNNRPERNTQKIRGFLIGQIGRHSNISREIIHIGDILKLAYSQLLQAQRKIGGRIVIIEAEECLVEHYKKHGFKVVRRKDDNSEISLTQLAKKL